VVVDRIDTFSVMRVHHVLTRHARQRKTRPGYINRRVFVVFIAQPSPESLVITVSASLMAIMQDPIWTDRSM